MLADLTILLRRTVLPQMKSNTFLDYSPQARRYP